ncbi:enoyl-CoA hydratase-related protein [Pseudarthrobacter sp. NPDC092419]|uniref:enoyl-CoA hydratase-related protein n=1 Tax=Pseudarthrobacter sp. NPDC092419 TaxID=3364414 RepID=UPI00382882E5
MLVEARGQILLVTLNRPDVLNAVNGAMTDQLSTALTRLETSPELRIGVITGSGRAFCAGLDMKAVARGASIEATRHPTWGFAGIATRKITKPLIAAVNGDAVGGGLEIVLACDLALAASTVRFGLPEVRRGLFAAGGGVHRASQQLPKKIASDLLLTGRLFTAEEAACWGMVNSVVSPGDVLPEAIRLAQLVAANAPLAVQATKRLIRAATPGSFTDAPTIALTDIEAATVFASKDASEGMAAFVEGRPPVFTGQ